MPRKHFRSRLSIYDIQEIDPTAPIPAPDHDLVRHALVDFDELAVLSPKAHEQLVDDLVQAVRYWRGGIRAGKRGLSDKAAALQIFLSDVKRALEGAGLRPTRWRKRYDRGDGPDADAPESFFFRLAREIADVSGKALPQDLKLPGKRAAQHQYGVMSPAMEAAQKAELAARGRRVDKRQRRPNSRTL